MVDLQMAKGGRRTLVAGAVSLALAGAVTRGIGAVYHVVIVRAVGPEALGLFQMAMPVYRLASGVASMGFQVAVVRLIADGLGRRRPEEARAYARSAVMAAMISGPAMGLLLCFGAPHLATFLFKDTRLTLPIICLGLLLIPATISTILRGIVRGFGATPSLAGANIAEAALRVPGALAMLAVFLPFGMGPAAAAMVGGMIVGELGSLAVLGFKTRSLMADRSPGEPLPSRKSKRDSGHGRALLRLGIPAMISGLLNSLISLVNAALVPRQLQSAGFTQSGEAQAFGQVTGMVAPLLYLPMSLVGPVIQVVTPAVAERMGAGRRDRVLELLRKAFFLAGAAGVVYAVMLALVPGRIGHILYGAPHIAPLIRPLSVAAPFVYLGIVSGGVLYGLGHVGSVTISVFAGNLTRCILICTMVPKPAWGILGAVWALVADHVVTAILNIACLGWFMSRRQRKP
jgi:stage V sporulation protein B